MTNGKSSSNQKSDNTQTFEDRDYFVMGPNVYTRGEYVWLLRHMGRTEEQIAKVTEYPAKISPFWVELIRDKGYKQYGVQVKRDGTVVKIKLVEHLALFYNNSTPYSFHYVSGDIIVYTLAKDEDHAKKNAEKKRLEQFLSKSWLSHLEQEAENESYKQEMMKQALVAGINNWYSNQYLSTP